MIVVYAVLGVLIVFLLGMIILPIIGKHTALGEREIVGRISFVQIAPCTMPKRLGITMDDGTYLIIDKADFKVDVNKIYHIKVKETKYWWGISSDIVESEPNLVMN